MENVKYSILNPYDSGDYKIISPITMHDLGIEQIVSQLTAKESEQKLILNILSKTYINPKVTEYRCDVFEDIYSNKAMREEMMKILGKINFLRDYGGFGREYDEHSGIWDLMHRLDEINDFIKCVDSLHDCLQNQTIKSEGLKGLKKYVEEIYASNGFAELKKDISKLKTETNEIKSITVGINLDERFEADGIGIISINSKQFTKSNVISNFCDHLTGKVKVNNSTEWKDDYRFEPFDSGDGKVIRAAIGQIDAISSGTVGIVNIPDGDNSKDVTRYTDRVVNHMLSMMVKKLKDVLNKYVAVTITDMTDLIPELMYYSKWAEYIEKLQAKGASFNKPSIYIGEDPFYMSAKGIYNIKLAAFDTEEAGNIVTNDLDFDKEHRVYILTGANRGGKTTITQTIGQLYVLAQGGIFIPGDSYTFSPVDSIYTHFPADEDKTLDLGRLGEECKRFKELYENSTDRSLLLLNETFSTTSFEEGYYIAKDSVRAILNKGIRTIYNTHMHKLAFDIEQMNEESCDAKAYSLVVRNEGEKRSYKVELSTPSGKSFASDIARKYGVTYDMLVK